MDRGLLRSAIAVGFLLVTIFYLGGSLLHLAAPIAVTVSYTLILTRTIPKVNGKKAVNMNDKTSITARMSLFGRQHPCV